jgi:hypothetical protein
MSKDIDELTALFWKFHNDRLRNPELVEMDEYIQPILNLITEARIAELELWYNEWGYGEEQIGDGSWEDFRDYRMKQLKEKA